MVVTNYALQFGELDPIRLDQPGLTVAQLEADHARHDTCYPVDGDGLARRKAELQHRRAEDASMTTLPRVPWAQNQLEIDRCGATGQWVHETVIRRGLGLHTLLPWMCPNVIDRQQHAHAYRRWAEL